MRRSTQMSTGFIDFPKYIFSRCVEAESHTPVKLWDFETTSDPSWGSSKSDVKRISSGYSNSSSAQVTSRYGTV